MAVPAGIACTAAAATPALRDLGDLAVVLVGLITSAVLWTAGRQPGRSAAWRMFAVAPLFPVLGAVLASLVDATDPLDRVVVRWLPTVPGYVIATVALLGLAGRSRLRTGRLAAAEAALFLTSCVVVVRLLVAGPVGEWTGMELGERLVLGAAVAVTSATMTAALVLLGVVEPARRRMAAVLLVGTVLLTSGRGLGTSAVLSDTDALVALSRFLVAGGLLLLALAVLTDPGRDAAPPAPRTVSRTVEIGHLLPLGALVVAVTAAGVVRFLGRQLDVATWAGLLLAVLLALVQRWTSACQEQRLSARLRRSEAYFRSLVHSGTDAVVLLDDALRVTWASPALDRVLGAAAAGLVGRPLLDAVHPEDTAAIEEALVPGGPVSPLLGLRLADTDGVWRCLEAGIADLRDDPDVGAVVLQCRDMTERQAREASLQNVAYIDPMTTLPNRAGMLQLLGERLTGPAGAEEPGTLLLVELDGILEAREHAGRDVVGAVVAEIGRRLRATVRGDDVVARMGGGSFGVLTTGQGADADRLAGRILSVVEQPIPTDAGIVDLTAGVGLVELDPGLAVEDLLARADLAVRAARAAGQGMAQRYRPALGEAAARREQLREDLRSARARGELFVLFQPVVSLADRRMSGVEALLRWRHPTLVGDPAGGVPADRRAVRPPGRAAALRAGGGRHDGRRLAGVRGRCAHRPGRAGRLRGHRRDGGRRRGGAAPLRPGARAAGARDQPRDRHLPRGARRPRRRDPPAHGRARGPHRLRWRLLGADAPDAAADRHGQARPRLRVPHRPRPEDARAVRVGPRHRPGPGHVGHRGGGGDLRPARRAEQLRLRLRAGLPARPPDAARAARGRAPRRGGGGVAGSGQLPMSDGAR
ncbi:diguanylate cyclase [Blastococcus sp. TML/M2B]|nr:diguanylate cyclase [Blastococcus sp. TML/M2B]MBN1093609.1 diguanylate cyclase [Blastococcus sp. TML/M2B]